MSGLAPAAVYLSAVLIAVCGVVWFVAKATKQAWTAIAGVTFAAVSTVCIGYLAIEKFVGVHYTKGFYMSASLLVVVGVVSGIALRRNR
jgi:uncharacterized membrane protein